VGAVTLRVGKATLGDVRALRHAVLRPGLPLGVLDAPAEDARATDIAAWDGERVVGCARVFPEPFGDASDAWRLRGMAVDPARQGQGIGRLVLAEAVETARAGGASLLWADARTTALRFYAANGFDRVGEEFLHGESGLPHYKIVLPLDAQLLDPQSLGPQPRV
jgi:GNAT superfamily N-acetyltransferase